MNRTLAVAAAALLIGCAPEANAPPPTGSSTVALNAKGSVFTVNRFEGSISRVTVGEPIARLELGDRPARVTAFGDRLLVTLLGERGVAVVDSDFELEQVLPTGSEPFGIVADVKARRFFVAESQEGQVVSWNRDLQVMDRYEVRGEPRWLALHPDQRHLFVVGARSPDLASIDLDTGRVQRMVTPRFLVGSPRRKVDVRFTGDPAISANGRTLWVPGILADVETPIEPTSAGYGKTPDPDAPERFTPVVFAWTLEDSGRPAPVEPTAYRIEGVSDGVAVRSYPSSVRVAPTGVLAIPLEASDVVLFALPGPLSDDPARTFGVATVVMAHTPRGPNGVVVDRDGDVWSYSFIARRLVRLESAPVLHRLRGLEVGEISELEIHPVGVQVSPASLGREREIGLDLFYSAIDHRVVEPSLGVSCSTCHPDGRDDGRTWNFKDRGLRQTPSLVGDVSQTEPVTWNGSVASAADEAAFASNVLLGGRGLTFYEADYVQGFLESIPAVDAAPDGDAAAELRGQALFYRADVGCGECHSGRRFTDNAMHAVFAERTNTPSLTGIAATAPYFHDGSARSLEAVLRQSADGSMGDTSMLDEGELADLAAYLRSL